MTPHTFDVIRIWTERQPSGVPLFPVTVAHELRALNVNPLDAADALARLACQGNLRRVFAVRDPTGTVLRRVYLHLDDIEPTLRGRFNRPFSRDDADIIPAFERVLP